MGCAKEVPLITLPESGALMALVLVTHRCQLNCAYCELASAQEDMPLELVEKVMEDIHRLVPVERPVTFVWHGGEPLMRGVDFFRWIHAFQKEMRSTRTVRNVLQTNGLLLSEEFLDFLQETGDFRPNISIDGPDAVTRATRGVGTATYDALFRKLQERGLEFGLSIVASPELARHREEALAYFAERGIQNLGVTPFHACTPGSGAYPDLYADVVLGERGPNPFGASLVQGILDQRLRSDCRFSSFSDGCHRHVVCVDVSGDVHTCLRGQWAGLWTYGNAAEGGLDTWWASTFGPPPFRPNLPQESEPCEWKGNWHGGCPSNAKAMNGGSERADFYCASFKRLFQAAETGLVEEMLAWAEGQRSGPC